VIAENGSHQPRRTRPATSTLLRGIVFLAIVAVVALFGASQMAPAAASAPTVYVDDSAAAEGDGSAQNPVQTIQEGLALLPEDGGTVAVHPGTYVGPIVIETEGTTLQGLATPVFTDGYVTAFTDVDDDDDEVVIKLAAPIAFRVDVVEVKASDVQVRDIVVDVTPFVSLGLNSALSAKAEDDDFYEDIVFSEMVVRGIIDTAGWSRNADATFHQITSTDFGAIGLNPTGNGKVTV